MNFALFYIAFVLPGGVGLYMCLIVRVWGVAIAGLWKPCSLRQSSYVSVMEASHKSILLLLQAGGPLHLAARDGLIVVPRPHVPRRSGDFCLTHLPLYVRSLLFVLQIVM